MSTELLGYDGLAAALRTAFGMSWSIYDTSGGNYCLRAVTETGHWVHVTDAYDSLTPLTWRIDAADNSGECLGYGVTVFADNECGEFVYANGDPFAITNDDVIALVRDALANLAAAAR